MACCLRSEPEVDPYRHELVESYSFEGEYLGPRYLNDVVRPGRKVCGLAACVVLRSKKSGFYYLRTYAVERELVRTPSFVVVTFTRVGESVREAAYRGLISNGIKMEWLTQVGTMDMSPQHGYLNYGCIFTFDCEEEPNEVIPLGVMALRAFTLEGLHAYAQSDQSMYVDLRYAILHGLSASILPSVEEIDALYDAFADADVDDSEDSARSEEDVAGVPIDAVRLRDRLKSAIHANNLNMRALTFWMSEKVGGMYLVYGPHMLGIPYVTESNDFPNLIVYFEETPDALRNLYKEFPTMPPGSKRYVLPATNYGGSADIVLVATDFDDIVVRQSIVAMACLERHNFDDMFKIELERRKAVQGLTELSAVSYNSDHFNARSTTLYKRVREVWDRRLDR